MNLLVLAGIALVALGSWLIYLGQKQDGDTGQREVIEVVENSTTPIKKDTERILDLLNRVVDESEKKHPDVIAEARRKYPHGFALFGYANGQIAYKPFPGNDSLRVTADWGSTTMEVKSEDDAVVFHIHNMHAVLGEWSMNVKHYEWICHPIEPPEPVREGLFATPRGLLISVAESFPNELEGGHMYLVGFTIEKELTAPLGTRIATEIRDAQFIPNKPK